MAIDGKSIKVKIFGSEYPLRGESEELTKKVANYVDQIGLLVNGVLRLGPVDEVLTERSLSELYGIPVEVASFAGHRIVLARGHQRGGAGHG